MCCKLAGVICVIGSGLYIGISLALIMKKRVSELGELERTVHILESEIKYHRSVVYEACLGTARRCGQPFSSWLNEFCTLLGDAVGDETQNEYGETAPGVNTDLVSLWEISLDKLYLISSLTRKDLDMVRAVGRCMEYPDIESQEQGFMLENEHIHDCLLRSKAELGNRMKLSVILALLSAILLVVILV